MPRNRQLVNCKDCKFFEPDPHSKTRGVCLSALAGLKGIPFRVTTKNACIYGVLDNLQKGVILPIEREAKDDLPTSDTYLLDRNNSGNSGD